MRSLFPAALIAAAVALPGGGAHASGGGGGGADGLNFVGMSEIIVPIVEADRVAGKLRVKLVLDAADGEAAGRVAHEMPRLRTVALGATLDYARLDASAYRAVDVGRLLHELTGALHEAEPGINRVLIIEVAAGQA